MSQSRARATAQLKNFRCAKLYGSRQTPLSKNIKRTLLPWHTISSPTGHLKKRKKSSEANHEQQSPRAQQIPFTKRKNSTRSGSLQVAKPTNTKTGSWVAKTVTQHANSVRANFLVVLIAKHANLNVLI